MSAQAGLWLLLLLLLSANTAPGPPSTAEGKLDSSQDLIPVLPLPGSDGGEMEKDTAPSPASQISSSIPGSSQHPSEHLPCGDEQQRPPEALGSFLLALREGWNKQSKVGKEELARFGICSDSDSQQHHLFPALLILGQRAHEEHNDPGYFHTRKEHWDVEESGKFTLTLHLTKPCKDYQQSTLGSITLLFFAGSINTEEMNLEFSSRALHPDKQTLCVSKNTQFLALTADQAQLFSHGHLKLRIVIDHQSDSGQKMCLADLQAMLVRKEARTSVPLSPVVLFFTHSSNCELEAPPSNQTFFFLCELQEFLNEVLPQEDPVLSAEEEATVSQDVLHSLPPLSLGASSSESFLLELINSSGPTAFLFPRQSLGMQNHRVELTLNPALLSILRQRLEVALAQIRTEEVGRSVMDKLQTLTALTTLPGDRDGAAGRLLCKGSESLGEVQYRAFLLLKALQTVLGVWAEERAQRAARADEEGLMKPSNCRLQSLTVSLEKYLFEPRRANINNCEGACGFPLTTGTNHAILLNNHLQSGHPLNRTLCCVPVEYDELPVIQLDSSGATISYKANMIAKKCECR